MINTELCGSCEDSDFRGPGSPNSYRSFSEVLRRSSPAPFLTLDTFLTRTALLPMLISLVYVLNTNRFENNFIWRIFSSIKLISGVAAKTFQKKCKNAKCRGSTTPVIKSAYLSLPDSSQTTTLLKNYFFQIFVLRVNTNRFEKKFIWRIFYIN